MREGSSSVQNMARKPPNSDKRHVTCDMEFVPCLMSLVSCLSEMRRKRKVKRIIAPDLKYGNQLVAKFINYVMRKGKKSAAQRVVYKTFDTMQQKYQVEPLATFDLAIKNASPALEVKAKRIGGATYQVPREVRGERKMQLAFTWILNAARAKKGRPMHEKLAEELMAASKNEGIAVKKKMDTLRMAEANKAFAHFAW